MTIDTKSLNKLLEAAGFKRGRWNASSRVKGWGHRQEGFEVRREYQSKFVDHKPWLKGNRRWKEVKTTTGYSVEYYLGDRDPRNGVEYIAAVAERVAVIHAAPLAAGITATIEDNGQGKKIVVKVSE